MKSNHRIGNLEAEILDTITKSEPATVGEVFTSFGSSKGYARTTVQTVMERLRKKGLLKRQLIDGVFRYSAETSRTEIQKNLVGNFVDQILGGDLLPIVQYLAKNPNLNEAESQILRNLVDSMEDQNDR